MRSRTTALFLCIALFACVASSAIGQTFVLGAENGAGPWGQEDGTGCGNDIVTAAFKAVGDEVKLEILPYARAKAMALDGKLAGCFAMAWDPSLDGKIVFAKEPLYSVDAILFENVKTPLNATTLANVHVSASVATVIGYEYPAELNLLNSRSVKPVRTKSEEDSLRRLAAGQISAAVIVIDSLKSEAFILKKAEATGKVRRAFVAGSQGSFVGFSVKHPDGAKAKAAFDKGYAAILKNGTHARIVESWKKRSAR